VGESILAGAGGGGASGSGERFCGCVTGSGFDGSELDTE